MTRLPLVVATFVLSIAFPSLTAAADAGLHHIHLTVTNGDVAARWYIQHLGCEAVPARTDAARCGEVQLLFITRPAGGANEGTALDHIAFSVPDLAAKVKQLIDVGVRGSGVRVVDRDSPIKELPALGKVAYIKDPWGTKIEIVEDSERLGFHHIHLFSDDPGATLKWYQTTFGGKPGTLKGRLNGLLYGNTWLIVARNENRGALQPIAGRSIDHIGFRFSNGDTAAAELKQKGVAVREEADAADSEGQTMRAAMIAAPDGMRTGGHRRTRAAGQRGRGCDGSVLGRSSNRARRRTVMEGASNALGGAGPSRYLDGQ